MQGICGAAVDADPGNRGSHIDQEEREGRDPCWSRYGLQAQKALHCANTTHQDREPRFERVFMGTGDGQSIGDLVLRC